MAREIRSQVRLRRAECRRSCANSDGRRRHRCRRAGRVRPGRSCWHRPCTPDRHGYARSGRSAGHPLQTRHGLTGRSASTPRAGHDTARLSLPDHRGPRCLVYHRPRLRPSSRPSPRSLGWCRGPRQGLSTRPDGVRPARGEKRESPSARRIHPVSRRSAGARWRQIP
jgi:hypothetical protein